MLKKSALLFWNKILENNDYWLTRFVFLRILGIVYFFAFLSLAHQVVPLIGEQGLLPANTFLDSIGGHFENRLDAFIQFPTLFWFHLSDQLLITLAWVGVVLSIIVIIGYANSLLLFFLWFLYLSFVTIGQLFYGYGWEIQILETGFLALFFCPLFDVRPFPKTKPPIVIIWLLRWLTFRIYVGAGLIKLRADRCWRDLTCLYYHYGTQPIPNPLSPWFHFLPTLVHKFGVLFNHFVELIVPAFIFSKRNLRHIAGILFIFFQVILIFSGNLSLLNWITIAAIISCFDDQFLRRILPSVIVRKADHAIKHSKTNTAQNVISIILLFIIIILSFAVVQNLLSSRQIMNTSFDRLHLVNTYGAFGSVGKIRNELIIEGTYDEIITDETQWNEYEFKAKPGSLKRNLPFVAPYQYKIDWQIWFSAMSIPEREPWLVHFVWKLLNNDPHTLRLIENNPFEDKPPTFIRIQLYQYEFLDPWKNEGVWRRTLIGTWLPPVSLETPGFKEFIKNKWKY